MTFVDKYNLQNVFRVFMQFSRRLLTGVYVNVGVYVLVKLALTSPTGGRSVGIVRSRTKATEFSLVLVLYVLVRKNTVYHYVCSIAISVSISTSAIY
jgi:hypothetical protein